MKCRVFLQNSETDQLFYVLWAELRGTDFYWGSPGPGPDVAATPIRQGANEIRIPQDFDALPKANAKISIHASGLMHTTSSGSGAQVEEDVYVGPVTSFREPTLFAVLLTAVPRQKPDHLRSPTRGGATPLTFRVPDKYWDCRWYMDFFVTPAGRFIAPPGALLRDGAIPRNTLTHTLDFDQDLILAIRCEPLPEGGNEWHPDKHLLIAVTPGSVEP